MNLKDLIGNREILLDGWCKNYPKFGKEDQFSIIGYVCHNKYEKLYIGYCIKCAADTALFGEGYFKILKGNIKKGVLPCGCSSHPKWNKDQYGVLCSRKAKELGYEFINFTDPWKAQKTKIVLNCAKHGDWDTASIDRLLNLDQGCPSCKIATVRAFKMKPDHIMIESFLASGAFHEGTKFWRSDRVDHKGFWSYWNIWCPECETQGVSQAYDLQQGKRSCECSPSRQKSCYINLLFKDSEPIALKFGIANVPEVRIKSLNRTARLEVINIAIYDFPDKISCIAAERRCKKELLCGVISREDMPDGWTETVSLEDIKSLDRIFSEKGVRRENKFVYEHDYRSDEGLKHLIAAGLEVEKLNT